MSISVIVYPPDEEGSRRVRVGEMFLGRTFSVRDVAALLREAGLQGADEVDVVRADWIEWRGGGPDVWTY
ncbi:hypothetical protein ACFYPT_40205 [Streptomyces sp. NPDC005529]